MVVFVCIGTRCCVQIFEDLQLCDIDVVRCFDVYGLSCGYTLFLFMNSLVQSSATVVATVL